jgi:hypothetical protein
MILFLRQVRESRPKNENDRRLAIILYLRAFVVPFVADSEEPER